MSKITKAFQGSIYKLGFTSRSTKEANEASANFRRQGYNPKTIMNEYGTYQVWIKKVK